MRGRNTPSIDHLDYKRMYSKELRELVKKCVQIEPLQRPSALALQKQVAAGLATAMEAAQNQGLLSNSPVVDTNAPLLAIDWPEPPSPLLAPESGSAAGTAG
jgi:hypothetical protein